MNYRKITNEISLYVLAFLLAIFLRLLNLGAFPLSDQEASLALQAHQISQFSSGGDITIGSHPAYIFLTGISFILINSSNFLARFWPAFIGATLVFTPYFFRQRLGRKAALILAFGLAIDPGMVAVSRQAGGPMMSLGFTMLALAFWHIRKPILSGILGALGLLSGPATLTGITIGLLAWLLWRRSSKVEKEINTRIQQTEEWKVAFTAGLIAFLAFGTLFFRFPQGISGWAGTVTEFLAGISKSSGISPWRMMAASLVYQPFAWLFAVIAVARILYQWIVLKNKPGIEIKTLLLIAVLALGIVILYPNRATSDLIWFSILLWTMAAIELSQWLVIGEKPVIVAIQMVLVFIFSAMFWNTLVSVYQVTPQAGISWTLLQALVLTGILGLAGLSAILISYTWSWSISRSGLVMGVLLSSLIYSIAVLWSATQIRPNSPVELWAPSAPIAQTDLLIHTIQDLSNWETGKPDEIEMIVTQDSPAMRWLLRDFNRVKYMTDIPSSNLPALIVTPAEQESPALSAAYRGQDFPWQIFPGWEKPLPDDLIQWLTFRQAAERISQVILWARVDLFAGEMSDIPPDESE